MKTKQFNYEEAKQHPELVVYRNGKKPLQVLFADKANENYKVVTVQEEYGSTIFHSADGCFWKNNNEHSYDLLLIDTTPEPEQPTRKPFNYEAACRDMKVVNSDGEVIEIDFIKRYDSNLYPIVITYKDATTRTYTDDGKYNISNTSTLDIYLYEPPQAEEPEMWVSLFQDGLGTYASCVVSSKQLAINEAENSSDFCIGQYKLIKG